MLVAVIYVMPAKHFDEELFWEAAVFTSEHWCIGHSRFRNTSLFSGFISEGKASHSFWYSHITMEKSCAWLVELTQETIPRSHMDPASAQYWSHHKRVSVIYVCPQILLLVIITRDIKS